MSTRLRSIIGIILFPSLGGSFDSDVMNWRNTRSLHCACCARFGRDDRNFLSVFGFGYEAVAYAADSQQVPRTGRIVLDVAAQAHDEIVDGTRVRVFVQTPDFLEDRLARYHAPLIPDEMAKQLRFH